VRRITLALAFGLAGYAVGAVLGYVLVTSASGNTHDRSVEAAMTAAFVTGPLAAVVSAIIGAIRGGRSTPGGPHGR